ncbi:MAG: Oligoribonuclease [Planctomycetes bacterium]|nr:Oligoribonuclease [Planctomycetota bacterium]
MSLGADTFAAMKKPKKGHRLVWMDLEMTGLDPERCVILEIATIVTEEDLTVVAEGPELVIHATDEELARMPEVVVKMHAKSGLTNRVRASKVTLEDAERQTLAFIRKHCRTKGIHPICGNSIGTDRKFVAKWMPKIDRHLSYRSVDVSSIKELARRWYPDAFEGRPEKKKGHRALADIRESIEELRYWKRTVFR